MFLAAWLKQVMARRSSAKARAAEVKRNTPGLHRLFPQDPEYLLGMIHRLDASVALDVSADLIEETLHLGGDPIRILLAKANVFFRHHEYRASLDCLRAAETQGEVSAELFGMVGAIYFESGDLMQALDAYRHALELSPNWLPALVSTCAVYVRLGDPERAIDFGKRALRLDPRNVTALNNLERAYTALGRDADRDEILEMSADFFSPDPLALARAFRDYLHGDWIAAWRNWELRFSVEGQANVRASMLSYPRWAGGAFPGKTLLVHCEQGLGDSLMLVRYLPMVKALGGRVVFECQPQLTGLFAKVVGADVVLSIDVVRDQNVALDFDFWVPTYSLPALFGTTPENVPWTGPYVFAPVEARGYWQERLSSARGLKVGVAWQGNSRHANDAFRSIPINVFSSVLGVAGVTYFCLQVNSSAAQKVARSFNVTDVSDELMTFDDTAALVAELDLVISIDTSVIHLAGAMGKQTWALLAVGPDARWGRFGEATPWYPSMRLFRQRSVGNWDMPIQSVRATLEELVALKSGKGDAC